jgi:hypothetical protein
MRAMAKAAAVDQLEEGLVRSAVAESSAHIQEPPPSATLSVAVASEGNGNLCVVCLAAPMNGASVQAPSHVCGVHRDGFHIEQAAASVPCVDRLL